MLGSTHKPYTALQWRVLLVITAMNFMNYVDRQAIFPLFNLIKAEFTVSDFQLGLLGTVFMVVHSLAVLPFGVMADRWSRTRIVSIGAFFWSFATLAGGLASSFRQLLTARALVGIGESAYTPAAASMISDSFPHDERARVQSYFNSGMFAGGALGMVMAGLIGSWLGWRAAFFVVAIPGILLAAYAWRTPDPSRKVLVRGSFLHSMKVLLVIRPYRWVLVAGTLVVFASGGFITWGTEFAIRYYGLSLRQAAAMLGTVVLAAGLLGVLTGGWLADWLQKRWVWGRAVTIGLSLLVGVPFLTLTLYADGRVMLLSMLFLSSYFLGFYHGPATAVIHDITPEPVHGESYALYIFTTHILGDVFAPAVIGQVADMVGLRLGLMVAVGANLLGALAFLMVAYLIAIRPVLEPEMDELAVSK